MQLKPLSLKGYNITNNVFLAPMAGYTEYSFRRLMIDEGVGLTFTELVSAKGICYKSKGNERLLFCGKDYDKTAVQIFGSESDIMKEAIESEELSPFKIVDINMGCPVPKVYKNGDGSALLNDIKKAEKIVRECAKTGKIITVKIRTGQKLGDDIATEFTKMAEDSGASLVTIHGRVRESYYSGEPDFRAIEKAKNAVKIPVIANGGIFNEEDAENMINKTGADGVMIARGAFYDPFLISKIIKSESKLSLKQFIKEHIKLSKEEKGDRGAVEFRKFIPCYLKGIPNVKPLKTKMLLSDSFDELLLLVDELDI